MVRILILFCFLFSGAWETSAQWAYKGLGGMATHQLTIQGDTIYASTSDGLYKKAMNSTDTLWEQVSFGGSMVLNTLFLDTGECLLLVAVNPSLHKAVLYKSADKGKTSTIFLPDTVSYGYPNLAHMTCSPWSKDSIYLKLHAKKTYDGGQNWQPLAPSGQYAGGNFIYLNPANSRELFTGGENMIFAASLEHSTDHGQNWQHEDCSNVFAGDNALEVMHVIGDYWYASGEGIVVRRHKDTASWTQLVNVFSHTPWALYMFGFAVSPANPDYLYVSGANSHSPAKDVVRLLRSSDRGITWDSATYSIPQMSEYAVLDVKVQHTGNDDRVWLGGLGVFTYTQPIPLGIGGPAKGQANIHIFPNPVREQLRIDIPDQTGAVTLTISNMQGQTLNRQSFTGGGPIFIPVDWLAPGVYLLRAETQEKQENLRFIKE